MKIKPFFAWYDLFIGAYWDRTKRFLYVLVLPALGLRIDLQSGPRCRECEGLLTEDDMTYLGNICSDCETSGGWEMPQQVATPTRDRSN